MERQGGEVLWRWRSHVASPAIVICQRDVQTKWDGVSFNPAAIVCVFWLVNPPEPLGQTSVIFVTMTDGEDGR